MKTTHYLPTLVITQRSETKTLERKVLTYHHEAMQNMQDHFGDDMMRQLCKQGNFNNIEFFFCGRLKSALGQAMTRQGCKEVGRIKMHKKFFLDNADSLDQLRNTYIHELAHVLVNRIYGRSQKHNANWTKLFKILGGDGEQYHTQDISKYRPQNKTYYVSCECGTFKARRKHYLDPSRFTCRKCHQKLRKG